MTVQRDAIGDHKCKTCKFWHNPKALPVGMCIADTPQVIFLGMFPANPSILAKPNQPMDLLPRTLSCVPETAADFGCAKHPDRFS